MDEELKTLLREHLSIIDREKIKYPFLWMEIEKRCFGVADNLE
jgi:hypothetical protein